MQTMATTGLPYSPQQSLASSAASGAPLLVLKKLDKRFDATHALRAVDLSFERGEIHAIVGENGAGKSTLIKLLTGVYRRSGGEVIWEGRPVALATPHEAITLGINAVHQEVVLCPHLTVAANLFLGDERVKFGVLRDRAMLREGQKLLADLGFDLSAGAVLSSLNIGQQQLVATARAERRGARFLIFDEPTAYLTRQEAAALFSLIRRLKAQGITIVYISHRLEEVFELADRVSILRDGALISTKRISETNEADLIFGMINRSIEQIYHKEPVAFGAALLETKKLGGDGFRDVSITVRAGEMVGLYGLIGAGRSEFVQSLFGRFPATAGNIIWQGKPVSIRTERTAMDLGIALAPESRRDQGLCLNLGVGLNINLPIFDRLTSGPIINAASEARHADRQIRDLQIKTASRKAHVGSLSGGNQQKIVIGKWLNHGAKLFIFDEPTVGVDVGTKSEIYRLLGALLKQGAGIIMISSYLPEVYEMADTLHVFRRGSVVASHGHKTASQEEILSEAIGA
jgi:ribose transport system ATP-binding protein